MVQCRPVKLLLHHSQQNHFCMDLAVCQEACIAETGKGLPQIVATKLEAQNHLECHCINICLYWN
uniref:Uncharacterized protein n=1 Tax=Anguilla anguilla TaxID=7936 RepID=A0A0E9UED4_ANGAN